MLCNALLTFMLVYNDGHKEDRTKWMTRDVAELFVHGITDPEFLAQVDPPSCCKAVENIKITDVKPYDCVHGPKE